MFWHDLRRVNSWLKAQHSENKDHGIQSHHSMANRWRKMETVTLTDFNFLGSKITADGDCSHEIKRCLLLGRKAITNLETILKSTDIILLTKVCLVKAMVFLVVLYGCESWTIKKAECWRIDAFELRCWRSRESLRLQGDQNSQFWRKSTLNVNWKEWCWSWTSNTLATLCKEPTH